VLYQLSY